MASWVHKSFPSRSHYPACLTLARQQNLHSLQELHRTSAKQGSLECIKFYDLKRHKMKISLVSCLLLFASVAFVKGRYLTEEDLSEGLEDELNELEPWQLEDPHMRHRPKPVKSLNVSDLCFISFYFTLSWFGVYLIWKSFCYQLPSTNADTVRKCVSNVNTLCYG